MATITKPTELRQVVRAIYPHGRVAFDTETTGLAPFEGDRICAFSLYHPDVGAFFIPIRQRGLWVENMPAEAITELQPLLDGTVELIGHNLSHDVNFLRVEPDINVERIWLLDTMLSAFLIDDSLPGYGLKGDGSLSMTILHDERASDDKDRLAIWKKAHPSATYDYCPIEVLAPYAEQDVKLAWRLADVILEEIYKREGYLELFEMEQRWAMLLINMTARGIAFDFDRAAEIIEVHTARQVALQRRFSSEAWPGFNANTPKSVVALCKQADIIIESTEVSELHLHKTEVPLLPEVIEFRALTSVIGRLRTWQKQAHRADNGRLYASWSATGHGYGDDYGFTRTGRVRSRKPNLTAVPVYEDDIHREKECFAASEGGLVGAIDLSQIEIRFAAHYVRDDGLLEELSKPDGDVHGTVAKTIDLDRTRAKRLVFGAGLYGAGDEKTAQTMTEELHELITPEQAGIWKRQFHAKYPKFKFTQRRVASIAERRGFIYLWNRRRMYFGPNDRTWKAWNWLIQGGVAALMKVWMLRIEDYIAEQALDLRITLQIHDEVAFQLPRAVEAGHMWEMAKLVEGIGPEGGWRCPIFTKVSLGDRWSDYRNYDSENEWKERRL